MKIGYEAKRFFHNTTGLGNYSRDLVRILSDFYPENQYFLYNPKLSKRQKSVLRENVFQILPSTKFWQKFSSIWRQGAVSKQIKNDGIEVYHGLSGELPRGLDASVKKIVTIHDLIFVRYPELYSFFDRKIHFKKFKYACDIADVVVAISEQTKQDIVDFLKINPEKIKVVYQGCHPIFKTKTTQEQRDVVLKKYALPKRFILNVGTIEERKNAFTIVKAIEKTAENLVIVGRTTSYTEKIVSYIKEHHLENRVFILNGVGLEELVCLYQQAEVFVYPSIFEGFGIPIIEAMFSKTPVITTKSGVFPEAGGNSSIYLENPLDEKEMQIAIEDVMLFKDKRNEIAQKGYQFVQQFTDEVIGENMMNIYNNV